MLRKQIIRHLRKLEDSTQQMFALMEDVPVEVLSRASSPESWSALQAANHVFLSKQLSLAYLRYKAAEPGLLPGYTSATIWRMWLLRWVLASPLKYKAPKAINMREQQPVLPPAELREEWRKLRAELEVFLQEHEEGLQRKLVYKHPYVGRLTLCQMVIFFRWHLEHHTRQMRRILSEVSPGATLKA